MLDGRELLKEAERKLCRLLVSETSSVPSLFSCGLKPRRIFYYN